MEEKKIILDFEVNSKDAATRAAELQSELVKLRQEQKKLDTTTKEGQIEYQRYVAEIKATGNQMRKQQDIAAKSILATKQEGGALDQLRNQLIAATAAYDAMSEADRNAVSGLELKAAINDITAAIKPAEEATGRHQRSVGDYGKALRDATVSSIPFAGELTKLTTLFAPAKSLIKGAKEELKGMVETYKANSVGIATMSGAKKAAASASNILSGALKILKVALISTGIGAVVVILGSLVAYFTKTQKGIEGISKGLAGVSAIVDVFIDRIAMLGGALIKLFSGDFTGAADDAKMAISGVGDELARETKLAMELKDAQNQLEKQEIMLNLKRASSRKEFAKLKLIAEDTTKSMKERFEAVSRAEAIEMAMAKEQESIAEQRLAHLLGQKEVTKEVQQTLEELARGAISADKAISMLGLSESTVADLREMGEAFSRMQEVQEQSAMRLTEVQNKRNQIMKENTTKLIALELSTNESRIKAEVGYQSEDFYIKQKYALRLYKLKESSERRRIELARQSGEIDAVEYQARLEAMSNSFKEFSAAQAREARKHTETQAKEASAYIAAQLESILSIFDKNTQEKIDEVNAKFEQARKNLAAVDGQKGPERQNFGTQEEFDKALKVYNDFLFQRATMEFRMQQQQAAELKAINEQDLRERAEQIEKQINEQYQGDIRKYQDNERKKTEILIEQLEAQKAAKLKQNIATPDQQLDTFDEDAGILESKRKLNQMYLDSELVASQQNAKAKYEARKEFLEREEGLMAGNAEQQIILNEQSIENEREYREAMIGEVEMWAGKSMELMGSINDLFNTFGDRQVQKAEEDHARESESLQNKLDSGLISQEEYDKKQKDLDKDLDKEQKKMARQQAIREKAMAMFQIAINTGIGIAKAVAASPMTGGLPWSAMVGVMGAIQLATVAAQPLPKAARGRKIKGKSHGQGGEMVVAEDGEIIMNKRSVAMFEPLLSEMSMAGGGIPFGHISDGGYTARYAASGSTSETQMREAVSQAMKQAKIYVTVEDIRRGDANYAKVIARGDL